MIARRLLRSRCNEGLSSSKGARCLCLTKQVVSEFFYEADANDIASMAFI